mgnify:CR=1 FL=1
MNIEQLRKELERDEGVKYEVYLDHLGYPTFGIGHLITDNDPEYGASLGTKIYNDRVQEAFETDIETVLSDCERLYVQFEHLPEEVQLIIANMMFNMGRPRLSQFRNFRIALERSNWKEAAAEGRNSRWYKQVTNRAERLMTRMENVS